MGWKDVFLYSSVYSCHLFLILYASVRSIPFLTFIEPIFAWSVMIWEAQFFGNRGIKFSLSTSCWTGMVGGIGPPHLAISSLRVLIAVSIWGWVIFSMVGCSFFFFLIIYFNWRLITLHYCSGFCHTLTWFIHGCTCFPHLEPPSHLTLHSIP